MSGATIAGVLWPGLACSGLGWPWLAWAGLGWPGLARQVTGARPMGASMDSRFVSDIMESGFVSTIDLARLKCYSNETT